RHEELDFGNQKAGDDTETTIKTIWSYYKLSINGVVYVEMDIPSNKFIVKGVDRNAEHMKAIGH
ncbi:phage major tail tube protein, partial [Acinetobacter baumannii]|nr:phage major tail tube protein [Acinetobacter baumannii]